MPADFPMAPWTQGHRYHPYFCEENVWHLCHSLVAHDGDPVRERQALFITNDDRSVCMWGQRAGDPVVWDYHVVLLATWRDAATVFDLDAKHPQPLPLAEWLKRSFATDVDARFRPWFRLVPLEALLACFSSSREHMPRSGPPHPPWPCITSAVGSHTLPRFLDANDTVAGRVLQRFELAALAEKHG